MKFHKTDLDICMQMAEMQSSMAQMAENSTRTAMFFMLIMQVCGTVGMIFTNKPAVAAVGVPATAMLIIFAKWTDASPVNTVWKNVGYYCIMRNTIESYNENEAYAVLVNYRKGYTQQKWRSILRNYYDADNHYIDTYVYTLAMSVINMVRMS